MKNLPKPNQPSTPIAERVKQWEEAEKILLNALQCLSHEDRWKKDREVYALICDLHAGGVPVDVCAFLSLGHRRMTILCAMADGQVLP